MNDKSKDTSDTSMGSQKFNKISIGHWLKQMFGTRPSKAVSVKESENGRLADGKENTDEMLVNLSNLQKLRLDDISVPKADIIALSDESSFEDVIGVFRTSTFTRVPVYSDTLDNPLGLIHLKDFALSHGFGSSNMFDIKSVLRPLIFVSAISGTCLSYV